MQLSRDEIRQRAVAFSERWQGMQSEKSEGQSFVRDFLAVFGIGDAAAVGTFEKPSGSGFADYLLPKTIAIEMKSKGKNLDDAYQQLLEYVV
ncbi:MAG: hypothetical protein FWH27_18035, partial [Planctomycetaceae bacterium]|nr:hypothetical protein [Planctomycetaceae bacterium]